MLALMALSGCQDSDVSRAVGARCESADDCDDRCLADRGTGNWPGGFCTTSCEASGDCPGAATCADVEGGVCLFRCEHDPDCDFLGNGWGCDEVDLRGGGIKVKVCRG